jgi:hypothetical protein
VWAWQLFAAAIAFALIFIGAVALRKNRRPTQIWFVLLAVPIPTAGLIVFALHPGPPPEISLVTWISSFAVALGIYPTFYGRRAMRTWQSATVTPADVTFVNRYSLAASLCFVLGVSGCVFMFEPWFGLANLVAIVVWVAIWIPTRWRTRRFETSAEIRAMPEATFRFLIEPSNWVRYQTDLEAVTAHPDGPLALGTEFTIRRSVAGRSSASSPWPRSVEARHRITAMTSRSFTAVMIGRSDTSTTEVQSVESGTRVIWRFDWVLPFTDALLGLALEMPRAIAMRRETSLRSLERLDEVIGGI